MDIYTQTIPYFYIIRNKQTGIMYAGSKWAKGCNPNTFMIEGGYQTSSQTIQSIINEFGLDIFEILRIDTFCDKIHVYEYETAFLQTNDCANSIEWYNNHNNKKLSFGSEEFNRIMLNKYGTIHALKLEESKIKLKQTSLKNHGVDHPTKSNEIKQKIKQTKNEKYGDENYNNKNQIKETNITRYGVDAFFKSEEFKRVSSKTCIERYGVEFTSQIPEAIEKRKATNVFKYGVESASKREKQCCYCGEIRNVNHEAKCKLNPNRKIVTPNNKKGNNPMAKMVVLNGNQYNSIKEAAENINISVIILRNYLNGHRKSKPEGVLELYYI